jgi:hypothetical protein
MDDQQIRNASNNPERFENPSLGRRSPAAVWAVESKRARHPAPAQMVERGAMVPLLRAVAARHGCRSAMRSSAAPSGPDARPWLLRQSALRIVSRSAPNWSAIEQTMALSRAFTSAAELVLWLLRKSSPTRPSEYLPIVAVYRSPAISSSKLSHAVRKADACGHVAPPSGFCYTSARQRPTYS